jgi:hypothetical protein
MKPLGRCASVRLKLCWVVFLLLAVGFVLAVAPLARLFSISLEFRNMTLPLGLLGAALAGLAAATRMSRLLRAFFLTTGISAVGWPVSLYLQHLLFNIFPGESVTYVLFFYVFTPAFIISSIGTIIVGIVRLFR